jgi:hypothetical protein
MICNKNDTEFFLFCQQQFKVQVSSVYMRKIFSAYKYEVFSIQKSGMMIFSQILLNIKSGHISVKITVLDVPTKIWITKNMQE